MVDLCPIGFVLGVIWEKPKVKMDHFEKIFNSEGFSWLIMIGNQREFHKGQWKAQSSIWEPHLDNIFNTLSTSTGIMNTVFINTNINPNMNGSNGTLQNIEEKNKSQSFRKLSIISQVTNNNKLW